MIKALFEGGRVTAKPVVTEQGRRYVLEGTAVIGRLFASERSDGPNSASPTGFYTLLNSENAEKGGLLLLTLVA